MSNTRDHKRFCEKNGWELMKGKGRDHYVFRKAREDGTGYDYTKISRGYKDYGKAMWKSILKHQLKVDQMFFDAHK